MRDRILRDRLLVVSMLLVTGNDGLEPWPATLAAMAASSAETARAMVRLLELRGLLPGEQLTAGEAVLGSAGNARCVWQPGTLQQSGTVC